MANATATSDARNVRASWMLYASRSVKRLRRDILKRESGRISFTEFISVNFSADNERRRVRGANRAVIAIVVSDIFD